MYADKGAATPNDDIFSARKDPIVGAQKAICFKKLPTFPDVSLQECSSFMCLGSNHE